MDERSAGEEQNSASGSHFKSKWPVGLVATDLYTAWSTKAGTAAAAGCGSAALMPPRAGGQRRHL